MITRPNFYRPEYLPHDPSDIDSVYTYLRSRMNSILRTAFEYPAVLPQQPSVSTFQEIIYLSNATANYTPEMWIRLDERITQLILDQTKANRKIQFTIAQQTTEIIHREENQTEMSEEIVECLNASHQIDLIVSRKRNLTKEIVWLEKMHAQLAEDPRVEEIKKKREELDDFDEGIERLAVENNESLKQMQWDIQKKENEIILLQGEINAVQSRIEMVASTLPPEMFDNGSYTAEELALLDYSSSSTEN